MAILSTICPHCGCITPKDIVITRCKGCGRKFISARTRTLYGDTFEILKPKKKLLVFR